MANLPTDGLAAAQFIVRHLCRPLELTPGKILRAATETADPVGGDCWWWTDDNAKLLEFASRPELWRRFPEQTREMLHFVEAMCHGPFIRRRVSTPRLEQSGGDAAGADYVHSLMHFRSELPRGMVLAGIRFHDGRTADNLLIGGNVVEFTAAGRRMRVNVAEAIDDVSAELQGDLLTLRYSAELHYQRRWRQLRLGRITYVHTIDAASMVIGVEAVLEVDSAAAVSDVVLTIGHDQLSHGMNGVRYNTLSAQLPGGPASVTATQTGRWTLPVGGASYYSIVQPEIAGFALAAHTLPREPSRLAELAVTVRDSGWLHHVAARYRFAGDCRGARLVAGEDKLLTAGGFYERIGDYRELLAQARRAAANCVIDYSISYDYGAEIDAFAKCFAAASHDDSGVSRPLVETCRSLFDTYLGYYEECFVAGHRQKKNTILSRQLAFVILGVASMYRATGAATYRAKLVELTDTLLEFEVPFADVDGAPASAFPYGMFSQRAAWVDGHSAALLALTQAARFIDDPRLGLAIGRGIGSYCLETVAIGQPKPRKLDLVSTAIAIDGVGRHTENSYWNFNVGLTLRCFRALNESPVPALQAIAGQHRERIELFELIMRRQIERSITEHDDAIEIRTSEHSGETNSETQPWVMLGLLGHPYD